MTAAQPPAGCVCGHSALDHDWWGSGPCCACQCGGFKQGDALEGNAAAVSALLAEFALKHAELHREWTAAVGTPGYTKAEYRDRDNALCTQYRDALTALGYTGPLLPNGGAK